MVGMATFLSPFGFLDVQVGGRTLLKGDLVELMRS